MTHKSVILANMCENAACSRGGSRDLTHPLVTHALCVTVVVGQLYLRSKMTFSAARMVVYMSKGASIVAQYLTIQDGDPLVLQQ